MRKYLAALAALPLLAGCMDGDHGRPRGDHGHGPDGPHDHFSYAAPRQAAARA